MSNRITRRQFLNTTAKSAAILGAGGSSLILNGCSGTKTYDLLITGGMVYDGLGNPGQEIDVGIKGDRIIQMGAKLNRNRAAVVIDARGMVVSPGFIDIHTHTDVELLANPKAESHIRQGITTEISGNCGSSPFPGNEDTFEERKQMIREQYGIDLDWQNMEGFFHRLEAEGMALNYATLVGHGNLRGKVVGLNDQEATPDQIEQMKVLLEEHMNAGAWGMSTGLEYAPGSYANTQEIIELCKVVAEHKGLHTIHMRDEGDLLLEAIGETLRVARETGVSTQISHLKAAYPGNWHKIDAVLEKIELAHEEGLSILADRYPYIAYATSLNLFFPLWARQGTTADFIARLKDPLMDERLRSHYLEETNRVGTWENVRISSVKTEKNKSLEGNNILAASGAAGKEPYEFMRDLLIEEENQVGMVGFMMKEENLQRLLSHPLVTIGSDGNAVAPYGILHKGKPHPRYYGTFPRVLGKYVREEKLLTLPQAIQKMTSVPATKFGFQGRGQLSEGYYADITIFDPDKVIDRATWEDPHQYPEGIPYVVVNGQVAVSEGETTGKLPGRILRKGTAI